MALSNIFREPRREITESVIGLAAFGTFVLIDYQFGCWLENRVGYSPPGDAVFPWFLGMLMGVGLLAFIFVVLMVTHTLGDTICDGLQGAGINLRPRQRRN